jgi:hypothetical protein
MSRFLAPLALSAALSAGANVAPSPPDPCFDLKEGSACQPRIGPPGTCQWATYEQRSEMQLVDEARGARHGGQWMHLVCVSAMYEGDHATRLRKASELIDRGDLEGAEELLRYTTYKVEKCDLAVGRLWNRLARAAEASRKPPGRVKGYDHFARRCGFRG